MGARERYGCMHEGGGGCSVCVSDCGLEYPRLWQQEERGGTVWDAGQEKVP